MYFLCAVRKIKLDNRITEETLQGIDFTGLCPHSALTQLPDLHSDRMPLYPQPKFRGPKRTKSATPLSRVELHIHLDGCVRMSTVWELYKEKGHPSVMELRTDCSPRPHSTRGWDSGGSKVSGGAPGTRQPDHLPGRLPVHSSCTVWRPGRHRESGLGVL